MSTNLHFFEGYSLVDITPTGITRSNDPDSMERNQQRNWETVLQCMSLRTQPLNISRPTIIDTNELDVSELFEFGDMYSGPQKVWVWSWAVEREGIYDTDKPLGGLHKDFEQVPIVTYLSETARFMLPIFYPYGSIKNVYFKSVEVA
jgi:hypothetical protein